MFWLDLHVDLFNIMYSIYIHLFIFSPKVYSYILFYPISVVITLFLLWCIFLIIIKTIGILRQFLNLFEYFDNKFFKLVYLFLMSYKNIVIIIDYLVLLFSWIIKTDKNIIVNKKVMKIVVYFFWIFLLFSMV